ncbi:hypothetical protein [Peribacillus loiseleuriae]|uniref:hypothetical protein n=1 Tax=Peribacillus loiseleuriae TaxID=1679170 RepID=UPI003CFBCA46
MDKKIINKILVLLGILLFSICISNNAYAADRHGAVKTETTEKKWTGISADIVLPKTVNVVGSASYVDWYLGLGDAVIESGISRTPQGYKVFLNSGEKEGGSQYWVSEYDPTIKDGDRVSLKLVNNNDGTVSLYVNNNPKARYTQAIYKPSRLAPTDIVKMVQGVQDAGGSSFSQASFSNVLLRANASGTVYTPFDGKIPYKTTRVDVGGNDFTVFSHVPLSTSLSAQ